MNCPVSGKHCHPKQEDAYRQMIGLRKKFNAKGLHVYYCSNCESYHTGHRSGRYKKKK